MNARYYNLSFTLIAVTTVGGIFSKTADLSEVRPPESLAGQPTASPSPTVKPCESEMSKIKPTDIPQPISGPISVQATSSGISRPVRDLPAPTTGQQQAEPREINPQNTIRVKTVKPCTTPTTEAMLSQPTVHKKKSPRRKKHD